MLNHWEIGESLSLFDSTKSAKISKVVLSHLLEMAPIRKSINKLHARYAY